MANYIAWFIINRYDPQYKFNINSFRKESGYPTQNIKIDNNIKLKNLVYIKELGNGQYGIVYLV